MLDMFPKTRLEWVQFLTSRLVAAGATSLYRSMLDDRTDLDADNFVVKATTFTAGELTAAAAKPTTDAGVAYVWDWITIKRIERQNRKNKSKK